MKQSQTMDPAGKVSEAVRDTLFDGALVCWQHADGYRFAIDSVILANLVHPRRGDTILDLGTGSGVVGLIILYRHRSKGISLIGIEKQWGLHRLAERNIRENGLEGVFSLLHFDLENIQTNVAAESCDVVVANPPYYPPGSGRKNQDSESLQARHQDPESLEHFVQAATFCVKNRGRVWFVYPADYLSELLLLLNRYRLEPKTLQPIYSRPATGETAKLVVVEAIKNGGVGLTVRSPFYIYREGQDIYSDEMQAMYRPVQD